MKNLFFAWRNRSIAIGSDLLMIFTAWIFVSSLCASLELKFIPLASIFYITVIQCIAFFACGLYRGMWRFASIPDLFRIVQSVILGSCCVYFYAQMKHLTMPAAGYIIYAMLLILLLSGSRVLFRWLKDNRQVFKKGHRVLIVGAGTAGEVIVRELLRLPKKQYQPIGFVDDDISIRGREIHGIRVIGECREIPELVKKHSIQLILIATPSAVAIEMRRIVSYCEQAKIPFRTLPGLKDFADGTVRINSLRQVLLEDLLGRDQTKLEWDRIHHVITNKTVLVTGGGGSIGSELCRQVAVQLPQSLIIVDSNEFNLYVIDMELRKNFPDLDLYCLLINVTDRMRLKKIFSQYKPELVFHAAAYKHVPLLETQLRIAMYNNIIGTRVVSETAAEFRVKQFVLISTDKAVNPTNIMGATKRAAEIFCQNMSFHSYTNFITVRFGNVLDSAGSVVPLFRKQLNEGGPLTVTHPDITRFFMTIPEAAQLILQAASMGKGGEVFVLDMGEPVKINYLAEQMIKLSGKVLGSDIHIQYTGLRPGEKLFEELFHESEKFHKTSHAKINQAMAERHDWIQLLDLFSQIEIACHLGDEIKLRDILIQLVPEYSTEASKELMNTFLKSDITSKEKLSYA